MTATGCNPVLPSRRLRHYMTAVGLLFSALFGAAVGCQGRSGPLSGPARILYDSLIEGNEAMFDSASANVGFQRLDCLEMRARPVFGSAFVSQLSQEVEDLVRARHTRAEYTQGELGIEMAQPAADSEFCARVDSLWYARLTARRKASRQP